MITEAMIKDAVWFTCNGCSTVGIVLVEVRPNRFKAYIGIGVGINEKYDQMRIAENGARFHPLHAFWPYLKTTPINPGLYYDPRKEEQHV